MDINDDPTFYIDMLATPAHDTDVQPLVLQHGCWICSISSASLPSSSGLEAELSVSLFYQPLTSTPRHQFIDSFGCCPRLQIRSETTDNQDSLLLEMPIRQPELFLYGFHVEIDTGMIRSRDRYLFRVLLLRDKPQTKKHLFSAGRYLTHSSSLSTSLVSRDAQHRLAEFLDKAENADVQLSFYSPYSLVPSLRSRSRPRLSNPHDLDENQNFLQAHSCILKTVKTAPMNRLLNTYPPPSPTPGIATGDGSSDFGGREYATAPKPATGPIREIRFEDSPPAAVEAIIRYIYLGQWPVLEPMCGYTVKDLMALATYLEIGSLQDHCVDLVLGRRRSEPHGVTAATAGHSNIEKRFFWDNGQSNSNNSDTRPGPLRLSRGRNGVHPYHTSYSHSRTNYCNRNNNDNIDKMKKSRIPPENAIQVLFGWGYKFPMIRRELIQVLVHEHGWMFGEGWTKDGEGILMLQRFREHEAFDAILCELVTEQVRKSWRCSKAWALSVAQRLD